MRAVILFSFILSLMLASCNTNGEQEVIVVPKNFKGHIIIIFNQKNGTSVKYEGGKRVYEIPKNGVLKTQFNVNDGWRDFAEYYYEKISPENRLPSFAEIKKIPTDTVVGFMGTTGTVKKRSKGEDRLEFSEFYIGTKPDIEQAQEQAEKIDIIKLVEQ